MMEFLFPFKLIGIGSLLVLVVLVFAFWVWMIVDCATRKFRNGLEKIIWILVIVFAGWLGALVYFIVVKMINPKGVAK
jgi:hypothetical protein